MVSSVAVVVVPGVVGLATTVMPVGGLVRAAEGLMVARAVMVVRTVMDGTATKVDMAARALKGAVVPAVRAVPAVAADTAGRVEVGQVVPVRTAKPGRWIVAARGTSPGRRGPAMSDVRIAVARAVRGDGHSVAAPSVAAPSVAVPSVAGAEAMETEARGEVQAGVVIEVPVETMRGRAADGRPVTRRRGAASMTAQKIGHKVVGGRARVTVPGVAPRAVQRAVRVIALSVRAEGRTGVGAMEGPVRVEVGARAMAEASEVASMSVDATTAVGIMTTRGRGSRGLGARSRRRSRRSMTTSQAKRSRALLAATCER